MPRRQLVESTRCGVLLAELRDASSVKKGAEAAVTQAITAHATGPHIGQLFVSLPPWRPPGAILFETREFFPFMPALVGRVASRG
jgi:hypothetical protein